MKQVIFLLAVGAALIFASYELMGQANGLLTTDVWFFFASLITGVAGTVSSVCGIVTAWEQL